MRSLAASQGLRGTPTAEATTHTAEATTHLGHRAQMIRDGSDLKVSLL